MIDNAMKAIVFDVQRSSYVDGPGVRTTVFVKGCNLRCAWCHNPESQSAGPERMWYEDLCTRCGSCVVRCPEQAISFDPDLGKPILHSEMCTLCGKCAAFCLHDAIKLCGQEMTVAEIFREIGKDWLFYEATGGGVTISGGECMLRPDCVVELTKRCHDENIHVAVDTAGGVPWESFAKVLPYTDLFLYDIKCITPALHRQYTGVDNALILENYKRLLEHGCAVHVRVPMIPECSANDAEFAKICDFLHRYPPDKVELLPYHAMGEGKYRALGRGEPMGFVAPTDAVLQRYRGMVADIEQRM